MSNDQTEATAPLRKGKLVEGHGEMRTYGQLSCLIGFVARQISIILSRDIPEILKAENLKPHQFALLSLIVDNPGISQNNLAAAVGLKPSNLVALIDNMVSSGLVLRNSDPATRRRYALTATNQGHQLREQVMARVKEQEDQRTAFLTQAERDFLRGLLYRLKADEGQPLDPAE